MNPRSTPMTLVAAPALAGSNEVKLKFSVAAGSAIFGGHYPHHPLVPGLYLVEAALQALALCGGAARVRRLLDLRLMQAVDPDAEVELRAQRLDEAGQAARWQVGLSHEGDTVARFKLDYGPANTEPPALPPALDVGADWQHMGAAQVLRQLAHRSPILLVDEAYAQPGGMALVAQKAVSLNEACYAALDSHPAATALHYPDVCVIESFVQASGLLIGQQPGADVMVLGGLRSVELLEPAAPGDLLRHELRVLRRLGDAALVGGASYVGRRPVAVVNEVLIALRSAQTLRRKQPAAVAAVSS